MVSAAALEEPMECWPITHVRVSSALVSAKQAVSPDRSLAGPVLRVQCTGLEIRQNVPKHKARLVDFMVKKGLDKIVPGGSRGQRNGHGAKARRKIKTAGVDRGWQRIAQCRDNSIKVQGKIKRFCSASLSDCSLQFLVERRIVASLPVATYP